MVVYITGRLGLEPKFLVLETSVLSNCTTDLKEMRAGFEPTITGLHYNRTGRLTTWLPHHILYLI